MAEKVIVTNRAALTKKYGKQGLARVETALQDLQAADDKRGLDTQVVHVDNATQMKKLKGTRVTTPTNARQNKRAVDAIYKALAPDYLVLLGSVDVVPHQDLRNPMYQPGADDDRFAYGDLPYACEAAYSQDPTKFVGPTRVVGRLPDLTAANDPGFLVGLLETASGWRERPPSDYRAYLALSAAVWKGSTRLSLQQVFHDDDDLQLVPPKGPEWSADLLARRTHFINCHGAPSDPHFYGQSGNAYPVAHDAGWIQGKVREGTVVAVECCYGAELYDPATAQGRNSISAAYLAGKAYAYFGSSTIAYGPADTNGAADLVCQYFLQRVLAGASLGRAALEARQQFAQTSAEMPPEDVKTLAQFNLLGDPSVHPVAAPQPKTHSAPKTAAPGAEPAAADNAVSRAARRQSLFTKGLAIARTQAVTSATPRGKPKVDVAAQLETLARGLDLAQTKTMTFAVQRPVAAAPKLPGALAAKMPAATAFHVVMGKPAAGAGPVQPVVALVAKEAGGRIVSWRRLERR